MGGVRDVIAEVTGVPPVTCPWRSVCDPFVAEVITLHRRHEMGLGEAEVGGSWAQAPRKLVEGLGVYGAAYDTVINWEKSHRVEEARRDAQSHFEDANRRGRET